MLEINTEVDHGPGFQNSDVFQALVAAQPAGVELLRLVKQVGTDIGFHERELERLPDRVDAELLAGQAGVLFPEPTDFSFPFLQPLRPGLLRTGGGQAPQRPVKRNAAKKGADRGGAYPVPLDRVGQGAGHTDGRHHEHHAADKRALDREPTDGSPECGKPREHFR